jgi:hypothetical protein
VRVKNVDTQKKRIALTMK